MNGMHEGECRWVLVVDDNQAIHDDFRKILVGDESRDRTLDETKAAIFGEASATPDAISFQVDSAYQGQEGLECVRQALQAGQPYAVAFVDMRMPPGWDGVETTLHLWQEDPELQVVLCTAYSDYTWSEMVRELGQGDRLLILKKPFESMEVRQLALTLAQKRRLARQARLKLNELESMVQMRTRELEHANEQLKASREAAEAASRAKSEFLANMSHEVRTPMTAILGFAEILLDPDLSESDTLIATQTIRRNAEYLLGIIHDVLDISKIEAGKLEVERLSISPLQVVSHVQSLMQVRANAKNLPFNVEYVGAIPETIQTAPTRLQQILINLVGNAIKFTKTGSVRLVTRLVQADSRDGAGPSEPLMQFDVIDTGIGVTEEQAARLFQPFAQGDTSTTREFGGTGLGLSISKRLAEMLGGDIQFDSRPGKGSTFRLRIATGPLAGVRMVDRAAEAPQDTPAALNSSPAGVSEAKAPSVESTRLDCRILLAEDGLDNQRLIHFVLQRAGADVTVVDSGEVAVERALAARDEADPFDVILMDMQMPVMDGYAATSLLRRKGYTGPIIALTAHAMEHDRAKCVSAGCDDYVSKPIDRGTLVRHVARWTQKARGGCGLQPARVNP